MLAEQTPARFIAFDLLARDDDVLLELPYLERRAALEALVDDPIDLTPMVRTAEEAEHWLQEAEGVIAKELAAPYQPGRARRAWSRSSACGRSTRSSWAGGRARPRTRSAR